MLKLPGGNIPTSTVSVPCFDVSVQDAMVVLEGVDKHIEFGPETLSDEEKRHWEPAHSEVIGLIALENEWVTLTSLQSLGPIKITLDGVEYSVAPVYDKSRLPDYAYRPIKVLK